MRIRGVSRRRTAVLVIVSVGSLVAAACAPTTGTPSTDDAKYLNTPTVGSPSYPDVIGSVSYTDGLPLTLDSWDPRTEVFDFTLYRANQGDPDRNDPAAVKLWDSGWITSPTATVPPTALAPDTWYHFYVDVNYADLDPRFEQSAYFPGLFQTEESPYSTSREYGGADGLVDTSDEAIAVANWINSQGGEVSYAADIVSGLSTPAERTMVGNVLAALVHDGDAVVNLDSGTCFNYAGGQVRELEPAMKSMLGNGGFCAINNKFITTDALSRWSVGPDVGPYLTSWTYGGVDRAVDTDAEYALLIGDLGTLSADARATQLAGLSPEDRAGLAARASQYVVDPTCVPFDPSIDDGSVMFCQDEDDDYPDVDDSDLAVGPSVAEPATAVTSQRKHVTVSGFGGGAGYARVRTWPGLLVEGLARTNTTFDYQDDGGSGWWGGYLYGDVAGCGYIFHTDVSSTSGTPSSLCSGTSGISNAQVASVWNARSNCNPSTKKCDGQEVYASCNPVTEYFNVQPWGVQITFKHRTYSNPFGRRRMMWRYVTKDGNYVMARDPSIKHGEDGNWIFVPRRCFPSVLPDELPISEG